jgi:cytochrome b pre-mRNA-processing protein 3
MGVLSAFRRRPHERAGFALYVAAVAAARDPWFYTRLGVPDTLDGRFDLVSLHTALLIHRLRGEAAPGPALAQAVFDAMFSDMDGTLREMGLDMGVPRRVRAMWEAFHGRALAYGGALDSGDREALAEALARNIWRGAIRPTDERAHVLAAYAARQFEALRRQSLAEFTAGQAAFDPVSEPVAAPA